MLTAERATALSAAGLWQDKLLTAFIDPHAESNGDAVAIVEQNSMFGTAGEISFGEIQACSIRIACELRDRGVRSGDVVAVQLPNWWHYAAIYLACVRIGAVINPLMPIFRERELSYMLGFANARVFVTSQNFRGFDYPSMAYALVRDLPQLEHIFVVDDGSRDDTFNQLIARHWEREVDYSREFADLAPGPNDVTEIMYTSGTTGQPKGVMHTANTLTCKALLATELFKLSEKDVIFMGSPLAHQTGFMYAMVLSLYNRSKCVMQDIWQADEAVDLIAREGCTITLGATPFLSDLLNSAAASDKDISSLRLFLCAGAPIPAALIERAQRILPSLYVMSAWGMTEMGIATATYPGDSQDKVTNTDGRALPHQEVRVVDEQGRVVEHGIEGRLQSRCATHFIGYLKRPEAYEVDEEGWLETGDNARMDADGYIRITGRSKDIIIRGGENIPVVEIEELLYRHEAIEDCAIVAMPDARLGERGCTFATLKDGFEFDFDTMIDYLLGQKMSKQYLPERLEIIDEFPRTPSGKIQKFVLREWAQEFAS